ncbi:hypothetical protein BGZ63DRAFT_366128 [Mariannaea sp. PMI_226]|nr:hypothetical protein BGZ63DRAFT_366128 [Mariannaea sp. PMI_226]
MEHALTCNHLKCRRELVDRALVTTCRFVLRPHWSPFVSWLTFDDSHIFCLDCAHRMGVTGKETERRITCLACNGQLNIPDDITVSNLNPSEEYKTSILSGLSPNVIMECAGRALSFWAYQSSQDIFYQQYLYKTLTDKYSSLSIRLEKTVNEANSEIEALQQKLKSMTADQDALRQKNHEYIRAYREKSRKLLQTQELYDKVKRKAEMGHIQQAASDAVDSSLSMASQMNHVFGGAIECDPAERNVGSAFGQNQRLDIASMNTGVSRSTSSLLRDDVSWPRAGQSGIFQSGTTFSPIGGLRRHILGGSSLLSRTPSLPGLAGTDPSTFSKSRAGLASVGLTSGLKVSQPTNVPSLDVTTRLQ